MYRVERSTSGLVTFSGFAHLTDTPAPAPSTTSPAHAIFKVEHLCSRAEAEPRQECRCQQRRMRARQTIDFQEIARPGWRRGCGGVDRRLAASESRPI